MRSVSPLALALFCVLLLVDGIAEGRSRADSEGGNAERVLRLERVEISGNWKTKKPVIMGLMGLEIGAAVDADALSRARASLLASGYFHELRFSSRPGSVRGQLILKLELRERHRPYIDTGFGFRDPEGWYLTVLGLRMENPLGRGGRAQAGLRLGFRVVGAEAELLQPLHVGHGLRLRLALGASTEQILWYEPEAGWRGLYDEHRQELQCLEALGLLICRPRPSLVLEFGLRGHDAEPADEVVNRERDVTLGLNDLPPHLRDAAVSHNLNAWHLGLVLGRGGMDGRPGRSLHLRCRLVSTALGADYDYPRLTLTARSTTRFFKDQHLALGLRAGHVGDEAPYFERFKLGGSYSLRGFRDHSLSPPTGHQSFCTLSSEYRFPLIRRSGQRPRLSGLLFFDAGAGELGDVEFQGDIDYEQLQIGAGYGIRLDLPWIGIIGFDVGLPVSGGVTGEAVWYYLTLGHSF